MLGFLDVGEQIAIVAPHRMDLFQIAILLAQLRETLHVRDYGRIRDKRGNLFETALQAIQSV